MGNQHLPGEEVWLVGGFRASGERKYHLSNLKAEATLRQLAGLIMTHWICEQPHRQMMEELALDQFEGRCRLPKHALRPAQDPKT